MYDHLSTILSAPPVDFEEGARIGSSREGRAVRAFRLGTGQRHISLIGGCHADEPVGPRLLRRVVGWLRRLDANDPALADHTWWIIPHINPDGEARNRPWQPPGQEAYDLGINLGHVHRELPGDDIEFGFPRDASDREVRPENRAAWDWWRGAEGRFILHVSLHGMAFGAGPWFLVDRAWIDRCELLKRRCSDRVRDLGYVLHDVERRGEKGFERIERGFCTRPESGAMAAHFLARNDPDTASRFRPSSMEVMRSLGDDVLTLVSEMPLFITPGVGDVLGPPDPVLEGWMRRIDRWRIAARDSEGARMVSEEAAAYGLRAMPVRDQMILQWTLIAAGLEQIDAGLTPRRTDRRGQVSSADGP